MWLALPGPSELEAMSALGTKRTYCAAAWMSCVYRKLDSPGYGSDFRVGRRFRTRHQPDSGSPSSMGRADYTNRFRPIFCGIEFSVHTENSCGGGVIEGTSGHSGPVILKRKFSNRMEILTLIGKRARSKFGHRLATYIFYNLDVRSLSDTIFSPLG